MHMTILLIVAQAGGLIAGVYFLFSFLGTQISSVLFVQSLINQNYLHQPQKEPKEPKMELKINENEIVP
jgi:hypothetical protein